MLERELSLDAASRLPFVVIPVVLVVLLTWGAVTHGTCSASRFS
jgi:hypothetical protein